MPSELLGYLESSPSNKKNYGYYDILKGDDILIGRDPRSCQLLLEDLTVSNRHMRIYSIIYDETTAPFVYAEDLSMNGCHWLPKKGARHQKYAIGKGNSVLLSNGDKIMMCDGTTFIFLASCFSQSETQPEDILDLKRLEIEAFNNRFRVSNRRLGTGASGCVLMAVDRWEGRQVACKIVNLEEICKDPLKKHLAGSLWREVELLKHISHPNIVRVEQVFRSRNTIYIIEELLTGGDLTSYIERNDSRLDDRNACGIVYQTLKALKHLHEHNIVHRDLKPENILMSSTDAGARIILTDFGQAIQVPEGEKKHLKRMTTICGTAEWVAPEVRGKNRDVLHPGYTKSIDMWSVGCLTAALLVGRPIFAGPEHATSRQSSAAAIATAAAECDLTKLDTQSIWKNVSSQAKDFVRRSICLKEDERLTAEQALQHPWFCAGGRKAFLETMYAKAIERWKPHRPEQDFVEDLDVLIEARRVSAEFCASKKRRRSTSYNAEDAALYTEAGLENKGFVSAKAFGVAVARRRALRIRKK